MNGRGTLGLPKNTNNGVNNNSGVNSNEWLGKGSKGGKGEGKGGKWCETHGWCAHTTEGCKGIPYGGGGGGKCYLCGGEGHGWGGCPKRQKAVDETACWQCGHTGHGAEECQAPLLLTLFLRNKRNFFDARARGEKWVSITIEEWEGRGGGQGVEGGKGVGGKRWSDGWGEDRQSMTQGALQPPRV